MKNFKQILEEVNINLTVLMLFEIVLSVIIVFLVSYIVLRLFAINGFWGIAPASAYLAYSAYRRLRNNKLKLVEDSYDNLREKLRTAKDYLYAKNPFVEDLQEEISDEIKKVQTGTFFNEKSVYLKSGAIVMLCILILVIAPYNFVLFDFNEAVDEIRERDENATEGPTQKAFKQEYEHISVEDDWYGEFSLGELGDEEMNIQLIESNYKLTSTVVQDPEKKKFDDIYPGDVTETRAGTYTDNVEQENQEIVKNYFKEIAK